MFISVLLPAPFSPRMPRISPVPTSTVTSSLASTPGKRLVMCSSRSAVSVVVMGQKRPERHVAPADMSFSTGKRSLLGGQRGHGNLARDDLLARPGHGRLHPGRHHVSQVVVRGDADAIVLQIPQPRARLESAGVGILN